MIKIKSDTHHLQHHSWSGPSLTISFISLLFWYVLHHIKIRFQNLILPTQSAFFLMSPLFQKVFIHHHSSDQLLHIYWVLVWMLLPLRNPSWQTRFMVETSPLIIQYACVMVPPITLYCCCLFTHPCLPITLKV